MNWMNVQKKRLLIHVVWEQVECDVCYNVWDELKVLSPLGIRRKKSTEDVQLCLQSYITCFFGKWNCSGLFEAAANWLVISVYYLAINTQRQWDRRMWHQQKAFIGHYPWGAGWCQKVAGENASDNWSAFICSVTGALIPSNVKLCREMNSGIWLD